jgi:hypothetical protein
MAEGTKSKNFNLSVGRAWAGAGALAGRAGCGGRWHSGADAAGDVRGERDVDVGAEHAGRVLGRLVAGPRRWRRRPAGPQPGAPGGLLPLKHYVVCRVAGDHAPAPRPEVARQRGRSSSTATFWRCTRSTLILTSSGPTLPLRSRPRS